MKTKKVASALSACTCAILLTACSSSGSKNVNINNAPKTPNNTSSPAPKTPNNTSTGKIQPNFAGVVVKAIADTENGGFTKFATKYNTSSNNLNTIVIDGKTINLVPHGLSGKWVITQDSKERRLINTSLNYTRFGVYADDSHHGIRDINVIAHGQITDSNKIPTIGKATYVGDAVYSDVYTNNNFVLKKQDGWAKGHAVVDVDYGTKNVSATITSPDRHFPATNLKGQISGNKFSGTFDGYKMDGHFFGPNAEEVGGTFYKGTAINPDVIGSFGAKKQ
ncbi:transferrin-binding protein-like solute binding protein [Neisseriaceae bacterium B1]